MIIQSTHGRFGWNCRCGVVSGFRYLTRKDAEKAYRRHQSRCRS